MLSRALLTRGHFVEAAKRIRQMGPENVVLSLGSRGALGAFGSRLLEVVPPRVDAVCPIGERCLGGHCLRLPDILEGVGRSTVP